MASKFLGLIGPGSTFRGEVLQGLNKIIKSQQGICLSVVLDAQKTSYNTPTGELEGFSSGGDERMAACVSLGRTLSELQF